MTRILSILTIFSIFLGVARADEAQPPTPAEQIRRVELEWEAEGGAQGYEVELATDSQFTSLLRQERLGTTKFNIDLMPGSYFYRVRAIDRHNFPGRWTPVQELFLNARPPMLISPSNGNNFEGNLPDTGIEMKWRSSGTGVRYLLEITGQDPLGNFNKTIMKQEIDDVNFAFFPQEVGKYQWTVHTLGPSGDEPGTPWEFNVEGVIPRGVKVAPGMKPKRIVRYVSPWWRNHWTLLTRYGQAVLSYTILDQDLRARGSFSGLTGFVTETINWEWHDPVKWLFGGIPWVEAELELDRLTVLGESVVLTRKYARLGAWYDEWLYDWRFSPVFEFGMRDIAIYQPRSTVEAARAIATRTEMGFGVAAEFKFKPFLVLNAGAKFKLQSGGEAGFVPVNGDSFNLTQRAGNLKSSTALEGVLGGTLVLGPRMKVQGRMRYETTSGSWTPQLPAQVVSGIPTGDTTFSIRNISFDLCFGIKF